MPEIKISGSGQVVAQPLKEELGTGAAVSSQNGEVKSGAQVYQEGTGRGGGGYRTGTCRGCAEVSFYNILQDPRACVHYLQERT